MKLDFIIVAIFAAILALPEGTTPYGIGFAFIAFASLIVSLIVK